jgi:GDP/UDP-N,N'-diacetylbacillosamine 2-epimerase (hydrolysing)
MKVGVLTSSRADYSIYRPLLDLLKNDSFFELEVIVFGTNLSDSYGLELNNIRSDNYDVIHQIDTLPDGDTPSDISNSMGKTIIQFAKFWKRNSFDIVFALGDRYEMFSAVSSSIPFNTKIAHISGGETTEGSFDNTFRHCLTQMSELHFTSTEQYKDKVTLLKGSSNNVYNVGALSIDNFLNLKLYSLAEFKDVFGIDMSIPSILVTFHPETVAFEKNEEYVNELVSALSLIQGYQIIITMPNADTMGNYIRKQLEQFINSTSNAIKVENFGTVGYLTCMKYCTMLLGNTSSGFIEASFFPKYVINLGKRQLGRIVTPNIKNVPIEKNEILKAVEEYQNIDLPEYNGVYGTGNAADNIIRILKEV